MAQFTVETTKEEQAKVLEVLVVLDGATTAMSKIAKLSGLKQSRVRYVLEDLVAQNRITKVPTKAFNEHYIRYGYIVNKNNSL